MITLTRKYYDGYTLGELALPDGEYLQTLELPWLDNAIGLSCIPEGQYVVDRDEHGRHQWYRLRDSQVAPRSAIEIHPANRLEHLQGCIAPCIDITFIDGQPFASRSIEACKKILRWYGDDSFILEIKS